jgi:hypothetical protein
VRFVSWIEFTSLPNYSLLQKTTMAVAAREQYEDEYGGHPMMDDDEEIMEIRDPEPRDEKDDPARSSPPVMSMFGEVSIFRDFFLAAFSDGYNSVCRRECMYAFNEVRAALTLRILLCCAGSLL